MERLGGLDVPLLRQLERELMREWAVNFALWFMDLENNDYQWKVHRWSSVASVEIEQKSVSVE